MKISNTIVGLAALAHGIQAVAVHEADAVALDSRTPEPEFGTHPERSENEELWKRKGGGGGGGRGGGGSSGGGGRGGGGRSGGSRGGGIGSPTNNQGGRTTTGTGPRPTYGGGTYYSGGAREPYPAGRPSASGIAPALLTGAAIGGIGFLGLSYLHGAYAYPYTHPYYYHNATTNRNETKPVVCLCDPYNPCGCDDNGNQTYIQSVVGDGSYQNLDRNVVTVAENQTTHQLTIYINGTLPNGTTAAGGTEPPDSAGVSMLTLAQAAGWWPAAMTAFALAFIM